MKIVTPYYYKDFRCIAGACTDTCCAGWDVDVDEKAYRYYKTVKGDIGKRLKSVMVPEANGGCTFTLTADKRCPFLNENNLCDLIIELGEDVLCETCAEFPRFINEYGAVREIGIAPSCKTAGELMFAGREKMHFNQREDGKRVAVCNDIDGFLYMQLREARNLAFDIIDWNEYSVDEICVILLEYAARIQTHMNHERDDLITNVCKAFRDKEYVNRLLDKYRQGARINQLEVITRFFDEFKGMEVINPDWYTCLRYVKEFKAEVKTDERYRKLRKEFDEYYSDRQFEYRQLLDYYVYRYFIDAVYDIDVLAKMKNAIVGYLVLKHLDVVYWYKNNELDFTMQVDLAHLYSRQFEHSYTNYEVYTGFFGSRRIYSCKSLRGLLV